VSAQNLLRHDLSDATLRVHDASWMERGALHTPVALCCAIALAGLGCFARPAVAACPNDAIRDAQRATYLADCRAYEMVSPPDKNGSEPTVDVGRIHVASAGDALSFASLAGFGDVRGTSISTEYMSLRDGVADTQGWSTHAITPPQAPFTVNAAFRLIEPRYFGDFSSDLSRGVFQAWSEIPGTTFAPNVSLVENLYSRTDLRTPGAGSYQLRTDASSPVGDPSSHPLVNLSQGSPLLDGASADFSHVVFESGYPLTPESTASTVEAFGNSTYNVFDSSNGQVHLVGLVPPPGGTTCGAGGPACVAAASSMAGQGQSLGRYTIRTVSADGSRVFFTDNSATNDNTGALYMRVDDVSTVQLNVSERTGSPGPGTEHATFGTASLDGSKAFFFTTEDLTDDATGGSPKLYMYDTTKPASDPHNLTLLSVDHEPADAAGVVGVIGASDDGRNVYFVATGQLVAGAPILNGNDGIYVWHDDGSPNGGLEYVGELADSNDEGSVSPSGFGGRPLQSRVSPDGRFLLFGSHSGEGLLSNYGGVDYNHGSACGGSCEELYAYDDLAHRLSCASCNPSGVPATVDASLTRFDVNPGGSESTPHVEQALSDDGRFAFFTSGEALVAQDTNGRLDAYEYDLQNGSVHLLSAGTDPSDSYFVGSSASGDDAFIATRAKLAGWDTDTSYDLYDARVDGGVPEPVAPAPGCSGEGCHGAAASPPLAPGLGSSLLTGAGNVPPAVPGKKTAPKPLTRAQKLKRALKACKSKRNKPKRKKCEARARRRFGKLRGSK
jgi:hypothetical protein